MPQRSQRLKPEQWVAIIIAVITSLGIIFAALINIWPEIMKPAIPVSTPTNTPTSTPTNTPIPCDDIPYFQITSPSGPHGDVKAGTYIPQLGGHEAIKWEPVHCVMDIDVNRGEKLIIKYKSVSSGTISTKTIMDSDSIFQGGDWVEIKIWYKGSTMDSVHIKLP